MLIWWRWMQYTCELYQNISVQWIKNILSHWFFFFFSPLPLLAIRTTSAWPQCWSGPRQLTEHQIQHTEHNTPRKILNWDWIRIQASAKLLFDVLYIDNFSCFCSDCRYWCFVLTLYSPHDYICYNCYYKVFCSFYHQRWHITIVRMWLIRSSTGIRSQRN